MIFAHSRTTFAQPRKNNPLESINTQTFAWSVIINSCCESVLFRLELLCTREYLLSELNESSIRMKTVSAVTFVGLDCFCEAFVNIKEASTAVSYDMCGCT